MHSRHCVTLPKVEGMWSQSARYIKMADWRFKQGWDNNNPSMQEVEEVQEVQADGSEKKATKRKVVPIVIQSSDDEPLQLYVQKKRQPNRFPRRYEIQRTEVDLTEYQPYRKWQGEKLLRVEESIQRATGRESDYRALLAYKVEGSGANKFVCDLYLQERIKKYAAEDAKKLEAQQYNSHERGKMMRYFQQEEQSQNRLIKCFRCNKKGHTAKNCLIERPMFRCLNCLGNHPHTQCTITRCFRCNEQGHFARYCFQENLICNRCGMNGHITPECGAIILQSKSKTKDGVAFDREDIQRIRCLAGCANPNGHFNCHSYSSFPQLKPYKNTANPRPMRSQLLQTKMCFTDCDGQLAFVRTIPTRTFPERQRRVSKWY